MLVTPEKLIMEKSLRLRFSATNNEVGYKALLVGITMVRLLGGSWKVAALARGPRRKMKGHSIVPRTEDEVKRS